MFKNFRAFTIHFAQSHVHLPEEHSGRVLDSRSRVCRFKPHWRHCVVSLSKTLYPPLSTGSTRETCHDMAENC